MPRIPYTDPGGMSVKEIAAKEGCPEEEIIQLLKNALRKLRQQATSGRFPATNLARDYFRDRNL